MARKKGPIGLIECLLSPQPGGFRSAKRGLSLRQVSYKILGKNKQPPKIGTTLSLLTQVSAESAIMTSSKIHVLSHQTIRQIAAGQVIENPASVVKELVENALDAEATAICVEIQEGGRQLIRVSDDGCGMSSEDALLSLERHATSKIEAFEEIETLSTMGFRGEAIPCIAAISKFMFLTSCCLEKKGEGTLVVVEGGRLLSSSHALRSSGTTVEVKSLFFNVPVRRKFQKSPSSDTQEILKILALLALAYPMLQFELISDQKSLLKTPLSSSSLSFHEMMGRRLEGVFGEQYAQALLPVKFEQHPYQIEGYMGSPSCHKPNRTGQHLFINQRLIVSPLVSAAVREGYGTALPTHRYPLFALHLRLPGSLLDINVDPQKKQVRFRQESQLQEAIIEAVQCSLRQGQRHLGFQRPKEAVPPSPCWTRYPSTLALPMKTPMAEEKWEFQPVVSKDSLFSARELTYPSNDSFDSFYLPFAQPSPMKEFSLYQRDSSIPRVVATLLGYCILDPFDLNHRLVDSPAGKEGGLVLLDQRAAYSRIHYEKLLKCPSVNESEPLLIPLTLELTPFEFQTLCEYAPLLNQMGFGLREFGGEAFVVDVCPSFLKEEQLNACLNELIQDLVEVQTSRRLQMKKKEELALATCRASLPRDKCLALEEAQALVQDLLLCEYPTQSPMGRPTCLYLPPEEIAKRFNQVTQ